MAASKTLTAQQRALRARIAANIRWSQPQARTDHADRHLQRYADEVDPEHKLPEAERMTLARQRRRAHMQTLAFASSRARAARKAGGGDAA